MRKKLLEEGTIRQFMKLAQLEPLASDFLREGDEQKTEEGVHNTKEEKISLEEMMYDLEEEESGMEAEMDMEAEDADMEGAAVEMEVEEDSMETEINITPDQAHAIIAVAEMLKDIMPDLETPESEEEMDMEGPEEEVEDMDMGAEEEEVEDMEMGAEEEELTEQIMKRVQNRLRKLKNK
tara:strand:+ start:337 stop:876 length:540 start_codon:yes stop_codon:yes gene_type:complete